MEKLIKVLNRPPVKNELDEAYLNRLSKDLKRVQDHTKQAEKAIRSFDATLEESTSIEKQIIALYASYGNVPYTPDKNDTIATAATSVILEDMIEEKRKEIVQSYEENANVEFDFTENITELKKHKAQRLQQIEDLSGLMDLKFVPPLGSKVIESLELQKTLFGYLKKILIKYLAISDRASGSVHNKEQVREKVRTLSNFFDNLLTTEWANLPEDSNTIMEILIRDGVLILKDKQVKLRGFEI